MSNSERDILKSYLNQNKTTSFYDLVFNYIDEYLDNKNLVHKDSIVYNRAGIDRRLFSKFRSNENYSFSRNNVLKLCIALELDLDNTCILLESAGYSLSTTKAFDLIIRYYISNGIYDLDKINESLYALTNTSLSRE
ncbi:MAG: hypothetical protein Q4E69_04235 [Bacilli bacterium]|nr:hypothetical protein [Bacilli bacterium]